MNSHLISKVLLKNFANNQKKIKVFDIKRGVFIEDNPLIKNVGYIPLSEELFSKSEQTWNYKIERPFGDLLKKYNGNIEQIWFDEQNHLC